MPNAITEETIGNLFSEGKLTPAEFGLTRIEFRRHGACHPSDTSPCEHTEDTDDLVMDVFEADGTQQIGVDHCENTCPNLWDVGGISEGIGGEYASGGTFSYITDDPDLAARVWARARVVLTQP